MNQKWPNKRIKDISTRVGDGLHGTPKYDDSGEYFFINGNNLADGKIIFKPETKRISKAEYLKIKKDLSDRTILVAINGTLGNIGFYNGEKIALGKSACYINLKENVSKKYIRYVLEGQHFQKYANLFATGSTIKNLGLKEVRNYKFPLPPLPTQHKIAAILSAYDDLIENNLKRIKLLEGKAQLTYEEWFSVTGIPKGWTQFELGEIIDNHIGGGWGEEEESREFSKPAFVIRGTDIDDLPYGSIQKVPFRWHKPSNLKSRKLQDGDIVFEVSGGSSNEGVAKSLLITQELLGLFDSDVMCASFCKLIRPKEHDHAYALILFLKYLRKSKITEIFEKRSASNIVNYNWEAFLKFQKIKLPEGELLSKFNSIVKPLLKSIYILTNQVILLKEARDILLPRLMTGMIDVDTLDLSAFDRGDQEEMLMAAEPSTEYKSKNF